jgi:hypothetical protein
MNRNVHAILFWGKSSTGYTYNIEDAGKYNEDDIKRFKGYEEDDVPVLCEIADSCAEYTVFENRKLIKICKNNEKNRRLLKVKLTELLKGETYYNSSVFCDPQEFLAAQKEREEFTEQVKNCLGK